VLHPPQQGPSHPHQGASLRLGQGQALHRTRGTPQQQAAAVEEVQQVEVMAGVMEMGGTRRTFK
jgi:hypothetical protein